MMQVIFFTLLRDLHPLEYVRAGRTKKEDNLNGYPPQSDNSKCTLSAIRLCAPCFSSTFLS